MAPLDDLRGRALHVFAAELAAAHHGLLVSRPAKKAFTRQGTIEVGREPHLDRAALQAGQFVSRCVTAAGGWSA
jgi:hypothetical protein